MRPLSVLTYLFRNKLKLAPVFAVLALAVFGISLTGVLTGTIIDAKFQKLDVYREAVEVSPFYNGRNYRIALDATLKGDLLRDPNVDASYPNVRFSTYFPTLSGSTSAHIYAVYEPVYASLMNLFNLELAEGHLPRAGMPEVALHETVVKGRGLKLGDWLDPEKDEREWLPTKFQIVGILRGPTILSLASLDYVERRSEFKYYTRSLLLIPRPGAQPALEQDLQPLHQQTIYAYTYSGESELYRRDFASMDAIVWAINSIVVVVLSLLVGLLNMIYFLDRMNEFGLLLGIGYPRTFVIRRALVESLSLTVVAWVFGILFSQGVYVLLNQFVFEPRGTTLSVLNWRALQFTIPVPIIVGLFAASTVIWQLRNLDPVSIIERRD